MTEPRRLRRLAAASALLALSSGCSAESNTADATSTTLQTTSTSLTAETPFVATPVAKKWVDLQVGDCLAEPPPTDPGVVTVALVDCAGPHAAEVYSRVPLALNTALANVADRECAAGFVQYTGRPVDGSPFTVTYLIDSNQDRTSDNPNPSSVICLLQGANGQPLTASARR